MQNHCEPPRMEDCPGVEMVLKEGQAGQFPHAPSRPFPWWQWAGARMYSLVFPHPLGLTDKETAQGGSSSSKVGSSSSQRGAVLGQKAAGEWLQKQPSHMGKGP